MPAQVVELLLEAAEAPRRAAGAVQELVLPAQLVLRDSMGVVRTQDATG